MTNLAVRSSVALVGIPLLLWGAMEGGFFFFLIVAVISAFALHEFYSLARRKTISPRVGFGVCAGFLLNLAFMNHRLEYAAGGIADRLGFGLPFPNLWQMVVTLILLSVCLVMLAELTRRSDSPLFNMSVTVFGLAYVSLSLGSLVGLRELFVPQEFPVNSFFAVHGLSVPADVLSQMDRWGGLTVASVFAAVWICDSAAYFAGRAIGKRKLLERISPNKTIEGALAGFAAAAASFLLARELFLPYLSFAHAMAVGLMIGVLAQLGDLVESALKREAGVKDSSSLIPGHGGMLDRFDGLIFVSPVLFLYFDFVVFARP